MRRTVDERGGRWVYQNLRWYYVPAEDEPGIVDRGAPEPALSSLVDTRRLAEAVGRWTEISGLPALVYAVDLDRQLRLLHPRDLDSILDESASLQCRLDGVPMLSRLHEAAAQAVKTGQLTNHFEPGRDGLLAMPICLDWAGATRVRAVVVALLPIDSGREITCSLRDGARLRAGLYPREDMDSWPVRRQVLSGQIIAVVENYAAWLAQVLDLRQELAHSRARNRSLMVRVEAVERRLVDSCSDDLEI